MSLTDREKEQLKAMIDAGEPLPLRYRDALFAVPHEAEPIRPGKTAEAAEAYKAVAAMPADDDYATKLKEQAKKRIEALSAPTPTP